MEHPVDSPAASTKRNEPKRAWRRITNQYRGISLRIALYGNSAIAFVKAKPFDRTVSITLATRLEFAGVLNHLEILLPFSSATNLCRFPKPAMSPSSFPLPARARSRVSACFRVARLWIDWPVSFIIDIFASRIPMFVQR